jgi:hypothetical protein
VATIQAVISTTVQRHSVIEAAGVDDAPLPIEPSDP